MSDSSREKLASIAFVEIPDHLLHHLGHLEIDDVPPTTRLPIETSGDIDGLAPEDISIEAIVAGMLTVLAYDPNHRDADLYRTLVFAVRPEMFSELAETGIITARNGNHALAEEIFLALCGLAPERIEGPVNLAISYEQHADSLERVGKNEEAEVLRERTTTIYRELLQSAEEVPLEVRLNAGLFFIKIHEYRSGRDQLAHYVEHSDDTDKAARAQRILEQLESQNLLDRLFKEAYDFIKIGDEEAGIERINEFLDHHPDVWNAWFLLGWGRRRLGRYEEAVTAFSRAIELGADTADAYNELAICHLELGEYRESRRNLDAALVKEPENTKIISNLGVLALRQEHFNEARRFFETVRVIEPNDPIAAEYLEQINGIDLERE